jgi:hypothetical protein
VWLRQCASGVGRHALFAGIAFGAWTGAAAVDVPPIRYTGEFVTRARANVPDEGDKTYQLGSLTRLGVSTFVWQPWFATVGAQLNLAQTNTYAGTDSSTVGASGNFRLNVFPRSRFPFSAFVDVADSTTEIDSTFADEFDTRTVRYGVTQSYRPLAGDSSYTATIARETQDGSDDNLDQTRTLADFGMTYDLPQHNIDADLSIEHTSQDNPDFSLVDIVSTVRHAYRPSDTLTVDNFATLTDVSTDAGVRDVRSTNLQLSSFTSWYPRDSKLNMQGNVRFAGSRSSAGGSSSTSHSTSANVSAGYQWTPALRLTGSLGGSISGGGRSANTTNQSVGVSYSPATIDLAGYQYSYSASASADNRTDSVGGGSRGASAGLGHGLSRAIPLGASGAVTLSGSVNQNLSMGVQSDSGNNSSLSHGGSLGLGWSRGQSQTRLLLTVQDSRDFGDEGSELQSATAQLHHDSRYGRYASLTALANIAWTRTSSDTADAESFPSSSLGITYRHNRFLGVRRLRYTSTLESTADSLTFFDPGDDGVREVGFENDLEYRIGRLEARFTAAVRESNGRYNAFVFLSLTRRIAGIF